MSNEIGLILIPFGIYLIGDGVLSIWMFKDQALLYQIGRIIRTAIGIALVMIPFLL